MAGSLPARPTCRQTEKTPLQPPQRPERRAPHHATAIRAGTASEHPKTASRAPPGPIHSMYFSAQSKCLLKKTRHDVTPPNKPGGAPTRLRGASPLATSRTSRDANGIALVSGAAASAGRCACPSTDRIAYRPAACRNPSTYAPLSTAPCAQSLRAGSQRRRCSRPAFRRSRDTAPRHDVEQPSARAIRAGRCGSHRSVCISLRGVADTGGTCSRCYSRPGQTGHLAVKRKERQVCHYSLTVPGVPVCLIPSVPVGLSPSDLASTPSTRPSIEKSGASRLMMS